MSLEPTPIIAEVPDVTGTLPASVQLDGTGSLPAEGPPAGTSITGWLWTLHHKPEGSEAVLTNTGTPNPTLTNIDMVGSYLISLQVTDNLGRVSHSGISPIQSSSPPYGFKFPAVTSMVAVRVPTESGLVKLAYGERRWLERGLWELVDRLEENSNAITSLQGSLGDSVASADTIYVNNIDELDTAHDIHFLKPVRLDTLKGKTNPAKIEVEAGLTVDGTVTAPIGSFSTLLGVTASLFTELSTPRVESVGNLTIAAGSQANISAPSTLTISSGAQASVTAVGSLTVASEDSIAVSADENISLSGGAGYTASLYSGAINQLTPSLSARNRTFGMSSSFNTIAPGGEPGDEIEVTTSASRRQIPFGGYTVGSEQSFLRIPRFSRLGLGIQQSVSDIIIDGVYSNFGTSSTEVSLTFELDLIMPSEAPTQTVTISTLRAFSQEMKTDGYLPFQIKCSLRNFGNSKMVMSSSTLTFAASSGFTPMPAYQGPKEMSFDVDYVEPFEIDVEYLSANVGIGLYVTASSVGTTPKPKFRALNAYLRTFIEEEQLLVVSYNVQGGSGPCATQTKEVMYGSTYGALCVPTRVGYTFSGWWTSTNGQGVQVTETSRVETSGSQTLFAYWIAN